MMDELLGRCTKMPIFHATDGLRVEPNTVYLIPARKSMMIAEGKLLLVDQMPNSGLNFPIDIFFRALAEDQHHRSIGVILSGTGSDGSRGLQAIKEVGGLVMIQEPSNAKFDGMPYSAVKTGLADVIADSSQLPSKLIQFITHPMISDKEASLIRQVEENDASFNEIFRLLKERSDIDFALYKGSTVARRIERRIGVHGLRNLKEYHNLLLKDPQEIQTLAKDMLIGVTRFFRDDYAFHELETIVIPKILHNAKLGEPIRVWVAGCSTGEEAYSIAILFDEAMENIRQRHQVKIFATDVDPDAIAEASSGQFNPNVRDDMTEKRARKYFTETEQTLIINPTIRQMVVFATHNLISDPPFSNTHLTICRNVLIYFQSDTQKRVLSMLHFSLRKDGYLFLGSSESLGPTKKYFETVDERSRLFKKSVATRLMLPPLHQPPNSPDRSSQTPDVERLLRRYQEKQKPLTFSPMLECLLQDYVPACIILNHDFEVVYAIGDVTPYTKKYKTGTFSSNINHIIIEELSTAVSTSLHRAVSGKTNIVYEDIHIKKMDDTILRLDLRIRFYEGKNSDQFQLALIFLDKGNIIDSEVSERVTYDSNNEKKQRIHDLESQLQKNQEYLQVTIEELETTNEELQSSNEELLAANEELQSTNEELQSVNEELYTVNSEYQEKIEEITNVNSDLDNVMKSTKIGILFLDEAMLIRNYTPAATRVINLMKSDIGRPFHHISHNIPSDSLLQDIANVIENGQPIEQEMVTPENENLLLKLSPYIKDNGKKQGCVLSITDITEIRRMNHRLEETYTQLNSAIHSATKPLSSEIKIMLIDKGSENGLSAIEKMIRQDDRASPIYAIHQYNDPVRGLNDLKKESYDICLIDNDLEKTTAIELIQNMTDIDKIPPMILFIDGPNSDIAQSAQELEIYDTLDKNQLSEQLLDRIIRFAVRHREISSTLSKQY